VEAVALHRVHRAAEVIVKVTAHQIPTALAGELADAHRGCVILKGGDALRLRAREHTAQLVIGEADGLIGVVRLRLEFAKAVVGEGGECGAVFESPTELTVNRNHPSSASP
jgi:hypothetical protein